MSGRFSSVVDVVTSIIAMNEARVLLVLNTKMLYVNKNICLHYYGWVLDRYADDLRFLYSIESPQSLFVFLNLYLILPQNLIEERLLLYTEKYVCYIRIRRPVSIVKLLPSEFMANYHKKSCD